MPAPLLLSNFLKKLHKTQIRSLKYKQKWFIFLFWNVSVFGEYFMSPETQKASHLKSSVYAQNHHNALWGQSEPIKIHWSLSTYFREFQW